MQCNYGNKKEARSETASRRLPKQASCLCGCKLVKWLLAEEQRREAQACQSKQSLKKIA